MYKHLARQPIPSRLSLRPLPEAFATLLPLPAGATAQIAAAPGMHATALTLCSLGSPPTCPLRSKPIRVQRRASPHSRPCDCPTMRVIVVVVMRQAGVELALHRIEVKAADAQHVVNLGDNN